MLPSVKYSALGYELTKLTGTPNSLLYFLYIRNGWVWYIQMKIRKSRTSMQLKEPIKKFLSLVNAFNWIVQNKQELKSSFVLIHHYYIVEVFYKSHCWIAAELGWHD